MSFITGWIEDKVGGYAKMALQGGGTMAGNAVGGVGTMVENAGRSAGGGEPRSNLVKCEASQLMVIVQV